MDFSYLLKCANCKRETLVIYNSNKDTIYTNRCSYCGYEFSPSELERLRHILDSISTINSNCMYTIQSIQRKS